MGKSAGINPNFGTAVKFAEGACIYTNLSDAPVFPTSATQKMSDLAGWESLGEPDEIGLPESKKSEAKFKKGGHQINFIALGGTTEFTFKAAFLESDRALVNKLRYGKDSVEEMEDGSFKSINVRADSGKIMVVPLVADFLEETSGCLVRYVIKRAAVSGFDTIENKPGQAKVVGFTFTALDSTDGSPYIQIYRAKRADVVSTVTESHLG